MVHGESSQKSATARALARASSKSRLSSHHQQVQRGASRNTIDCSDSAMLNSRNCDVGDGSMSN